MDGSLIIVAVGDIGYGGKPHSLCARTRLALLFGRFFGFGFGFSISFCWGKFLYSLGGWGLFLFSFVLFSFLSFCLSIFFRDRSFGFFTYGGL